VAPGERVVNVQSKLAARVRLLDNDSVNKNDPNDARSVAVAALRKEGLPQVGPEDHAAVMKVWVRHRRDLSRTRNRVANRLHAVLCELVPGGLAGEISVARAAAMLEKFPPGPSEPRRTSRSGPFSHAPTTCRATSTTPRLRRGLGASWHLD
jgi:hypothetical protein